MSPAMLALWIAAAGGVGAAARYLVDTSLPRRFRARFPWGIAIINLTGSFALGVLTGLALEHPVAGIASVGFLGGYTTFSTASLDTVQLLRERRTLAALANGPGVLAASVALAVLGIAVVRG
ncbi:fluoride efflux transporter FluC [Leucobacter ruminantium]|uniref:Fluoride-specific ion channel FluC n=1 Tax=Leucobacter ruminantium TaxID=1289170 RepID=A0A939LZ71_9MICO|nr:CrcB family protein [Leucobacter ruminantium]MBO1805633.1 CrcB family protein [Leucobacter ruminantium]